MTILQQIITIGMCVIGTQITRVLPFIMVSPNKPTPKILRYMGDVLPTAIFGFLIVMCLKNISFETTIQYAPEFVSVILTCIIHIWKRNMMITILAGTLIYILLVNFIFV